VRFNVIHRPLRRLLPRVQRTAELVFKRRSRRPRAHREGDVYDFAVRGEFRLTSEKRAVIDRPTVADPHNRYFAAVTTVPSRDVKT
jgi:hypothetical protein